MSPAEDTRLLLARLHDLEDLALLAGQPRSPKAPRPSGNQQQPQPIGSEGAAVETC